MNDTYLAIDLGASSGRTMAGSIENDQLKLREINRFWNGGIPLHNTLHWDFLHLYRHLREGISLASAKTPIRSLAIDTWGVDFGLLNAQGNLIQNPVHYRDSRTNGMCDALFQNVPREKIFAETGIQFMELNTLYQLYALARQQDTAYTQAEMLLFSPDLLTYWLTGEKIAERTIASTSQCYNPTTGTWANELLDIAHIRRDFFGELTNPGTRVGSTDGISVIAGAGHDTACAFAAAPKKPDENAALLSSGTWSLLGCELDKPLINEEVLAHNFTNEVGACDTIRFLKNMNGLWIIQELHRVWKEAGYTYTFSEMVKMAETAQPFFAYINPSDESFFSPGDMHQRILDYCSKTDQPIPSDHAQAIRIAYEGLALMYAETLDELERLTNQSFDSIHIIGGGSRNQLLNQMTADATNRTVHSGPAESTAIGNCLVQMIALGDLPNLHAGRELVRASFGDEIHRYAPSDHEAWRSARKQRKQFISP